MRKEEVESCSISICSIQQLQEVVAVAGRTNDKTRKAIKDLHAVAVKVNRSLVESHDRLQHVLGGEVVGDNGTA